MQIDHPTHQNKKQREEAIKLLESLKANPIFKKAIVVPKGFSNDFEKFKKDIAKKKAKLNS